MSWATSVRIMGLTAAVLAFVTVSALVVAQVRADLRLGTVEPPASVASTTSEPAGPASSPEPSAGPAPVAPLAGLLAGIAAVPDRPAAPGYDRDCSPDAGCVFGPAWTDDNDVELGRNGCDTRNDILARDLNDVVHKEGTNNCVVLSGHFTEPYTGRPVDFVRAETDIQIDHMVPLALAWDLGAHTWPLERRINFANDPRNLLAADGPANQSKGDQGPGTWLPINAAFRCEYAARFATVLVAYALPLPESDLQSLRTTAASCP